MSVLRRTQVYSEIESKRKLQSVSRRKQRSEITDNVAQRFQNICCYGYIDAHIHVCFAAVHHAYYSTENLLLSDLIYKRMAGIQIKFFHSCESLK